MTAQLIHTLMKMICAITKAKKRRTPITATDPEERNLSSELAPRELRRLELAGRIVVAETFLAIIFGGINLKVFNCYFFLLRFYNKVCKIRTNFVQTLNKFFVSENS